MSVFSPQDYWEISRTSFSLSAQQGAPATQQSVSAAGGRLIDQKTTFKHPHDGRTDCRQSTETIDEFLYRLPPSTTKLADIGPWIHIAYRDIACNLTSEDIANLKEHGGKLLGAFETQLSMLQEEHRKSQYKAAVMRKTNKERRKLEGDLLKVARDSKLVTDMWMLFPSSERKKATKSSEGTGITVYRSEGDKLTSGCKGRNIWTHVVRQIFMALFKYNCVALL